MYRINPDIQSAVATNGDKWVGFETVESAEVKVEYIVNHGLAGMMWWAMDLDDYSGIACGRGKYPLISGVKNMLDNWDDNDNDDDDDDDDANPTQPPLKDHINVCYYTSWAQYRPDYKFVPEDIDANMCTHINYGFAFVNDWGTNVRTYEWNDLDMYKRVMAKRRENPDLKVMLSVGGWTHGTGPFAIAAATDASRRTFAQNSLQFIQDNDFDGIDIDWEYPGYTGHPTKKGTAADVANYVEFLKVLKDVYSRAGKLLTAAMGATPPRLDESYPDTKTICDTLDLIHLMTYDFHGGWEDVIGHHAAYTSDGRHPNDPDSLLTVKASTDHWINNGCDPHKMTMGFGAYGRVFKSLSGIPKRLEPGTARGIQGPYTKESFQPNPTEFGTLPIPYSDLLKAHYRKTDMLDTLKYVTGKKISTQTFNQLLPSRVIDGLDLKLLKVQDQSFNIFSIMNWLVQCGGQWTWTIIPDAHVEWENIHLSKGSKIS